MIFTVRCKIPFRDPCEDVLLVRMNALIGTCWGGLSKSRFVPARCLHPVARGSLLALDTWARSRREEMTHLAVEFQRLQTLSDMIIRAHRAKEQETSNVTAWKRLGLFFFSFQKLRGELLRPPALHRLPAGPGMEVDSRAKRLPCQLLLGAVPVPPQRRHVSQHGECLVAC